MGESNGNMEKECHDNQESADVEDERKYVTEVGPHDVLLGRGTGPNTNTGNVEFRVAVEALKVAYVGTTSRKAKNRIVRKAVEAVKAKNGRFLSKLRKGEIKILGLPHKVVYEVAPDSTAIEKTKQALRYVCYKKDAPMRGELTRARKSKRDDSESSPPGSPASSTSSKSSSRSPADKAATAVECERERESKTKFEGKIAGLLRPESTAALNMSSVASRSLHTFGSESQSLFSPMLAQSFSSGIAPALSLAVEPLLTNSLVAAARVAATRSLYESCLLTQPPIQQAARIEAPRLRHLFSRSSQASISDLLFAMQQEERQILASQLDEQHQHLRLTGNPFGL